jgi:protein-S-isoprenylcysteine O-methyltransferase Ste14
VNHRGTPVADYDAVMSTLPPLGRHGEGWVVLQFACFALLAATVILAPTELDPALAPLLAPLGYALGIAGAVLLGSGLAELRRAEALTAVPFPRDGATLVRTGPYRHVRHPIYGGLILGGLGLAMLTPWLGTFLAVALLAAVLDLKRRREEAWLVERYPAYEAYRARTKALIPLLY